MTRVREDTSAEEEREIVGLRGFEPVLESHSGWVGWGGYIGGDGFTDRRRHRSPSVPVTYTLSLNLFSVTGNLYSSR